MKEELNIAAILKEKPNAKLWSPIIGECTYSNYYPSTEEIVVNFTNKYGEESEWNFHQSGRTLSASKEADSLLFPSKEMLDWRKFAWKKGDVLKSHNYLVIFNRWCKDDYKSFIASFELCQDIEWGDGDDFYTSEFNKVSDDEAKGFVKKIEEYYGGKLNLSTLEIDKQTEFKDGDIVRVDEEILIILKRYETFSTYYHFFFRSNGTTAFNGSFNKSGRKYRLATDSEKQQLFDALAKENKAWDEEKKMLVDLPKKCEFKPMNWCLMRGFTNKSLWNLCQFAFKDSDGLYHSTGGGIWNECIPYNDSTKHLLGTTDEWKGGEG